MAASASADRARKASVIREYPHGSWGSPLDLTQAVSAVAKESCDYPKYEYGHENNSDPCRLDNGPSACLFAEPSVWPLENSQAVNAALAPGEQAA
jgi:hypothetical protein